jgi:hypothetical protein
MHDPEPRPSHPRPVSSVRWLLLLTPSTIAVTVPLMGDAWARAHQMQGQMGVGAAIGFMLSALAVAIALSFVLGFLLAKWRWGNVPGRVRAITYGFLILLVNGFIAFAGCAVGGALL